MRIDPQDIASEETEATSNDIPEDYIDLEVSPDIQDPFPALQLLSDPESSTPGMSTGDSIPDVGSSNGDGSEEEDPAPRGSSSSRRSISQLHKGPNWESGRPRDATSKPPSLDEWANFFGKVILRTACMWYIDYAFRGIDEDMLSDRELDRLELSDDERKLISTPLAELAHKSRFMRKYGRTIVSGGDAFNAMVVLGAWMSRVNRTAAKYKPRVAKVRVNERSGQASQARNGEAYTNGTGNGRVPNGYAIYNPGGN